MLAYSQSISEQYWDNDVWVEVICHAYGRQYSRSSRTFMKTMHASRLHSSGTTFSASPLANLEVDWVQGDSKQFHMDRLPVERTLLCVEWTADWYILREWGISQCLFISILFFALHILTILRSSYTYYTIINSFKHLFFLKTLLRQVVF